MRSIVEDLEEQVEYWRARAEAAEAIMQGRAWDCPVAPLSLYETRILRILVHRDASGDQLVAKLSQDYPSTSGNCLKALISRIRARLPEHITPPRNAPMGWGVSSIYTIPDRAALAQFLATGEVPAELRRVAA